MAHAQEERCAAELERLRAMEQRARDLERAPGRAGDVVRYVLTGQMTPADEDR